MMPSEVPTGSHPARSRLMQQVQSALAGRYELQREIGVGGMAVVYLATNVDFQRLVAIKVMRPETGFEEGLVARFRTESVSIAQLRHPHIIGVHARGEDGEILWFEMDYVDGGSLESAIAAGPVSWRRAARYLGQAADALAYAHSMGIVHRDIKPSNMLIAAGSDHLVVTDFGIAKILGKTSLTQTGMTVGTIAYMSPEQLAADPNLTASADQYSLGVVAYEALAGKRPFPADTPGQMVLAQAGGKVPPLAELFPDCPADLALLVERMITNDPAARWPDLRVVADAAQEIALTGQSPTLRGIPRATLHRPVRGRRRGLLMVTAALFTVALPIAWVVTNRPAKAGGAKDGGVVGAPLAPDTNATAVGQPAGNDSSAQPTQLTIVPAPAASRGPAVAARPPAERRAPSGPSVPKVEKAAVIDSAPKTEPAAVVPPRTDTLVPTTAVLSIRTRLPGTIIYINGGDQPHVLKEKYTDFTLPTGITKLRITSSVPGCTPKEEVVTLVAGLPKQIIRDADCPGN